MKKKYFVPLLAIFFLVGCSGVQVKTNPDDVLYQAESLYVSQHIDYMSFFEYDAATNTYEVQSWVTDGEREMLKARKKMLDRFKEAILVYRAFVKRGEAPSVEAEQELISFIRRFQRGG
jgi:uncharacterized protein YxeA